MIQIQPTFVNKENQIGALIIAPNLKLKTINSAACATMVIFWILSINALNAQWLIAIAAHQKIKNLALLVRKDSVWTQNKNAWIAINH